MTIRRYLAAAAAAILLLSPQLSLHAKEPNAMQHAQGTFDVAIQPQAVDNPAAKASGLSRLSLDKTFHGALQATSRGEMLASGDGQQSGAYVALEKVDGTLDGRRGSFVLMHSAVMRKGVPENWSVTVVPDSGSGELAGLEGALRIRIEAGKHFYDLDYTLP